MHHFVSLKVFSLYFCCCFHIDERIVCIQLQFRQCHCNKLIKRIHVVFRFYFSTISAFCFHIALKPLRMTVQLANSSNILLTLSGLVEYINEILDICILQNRLYLYTKYSDTCGRKHFIFLVCTYIHTNK